MSNSTRGRGIGVVLVTIVIVLATVAIGLGSTAATASNAMGTAGADEVDIACTEGAGGGAVYVTDSGLAVTDNDSAANESYPTFPDDRTVTLGDGNTDSISFTAAGESSLRVEKRNGTLTCLVAVNATEHAITIAPNNASNVTVNGSLDAFAFDEIDFDADDETDLVTDANETVSVIVHDTGLDEGETVTVESLDSDAVDEDFDVDGEGDLSLDIPSGTHDLALSTASGGGGGGGLPPPPPDTGGDDDPASFELSDLELDTEELQIGETVTVTATVTNVGDETGSHDVKLAVDGETVADTSVTLTGGSSESVSLSTTLEETGTRELTVGGESVGTVTVTDPDDTDGSDATSPDGGDGGDADGEDGTDRGGIVFGLGAVIALLAVGGGVAIYLRQ
ncbi:CARDB domain-containing protein [Halovivax cerinus]|uniref:CARDB domain-containing protein n=1 Tax=Halovivax cerinus TaxID=1487865 RepID=A0ABD5NKB5_9EURY|nr:CARDB domain-containing protein [Halovivax cerinus]